MDDLTLHRLNMVVGRSLRYNLPPSPYRPTPNVPCTIRALTYFAGRACLPFPLPVCLNSRHDVVALHHPVAHFT